MEKKENLIDLEKISSEEEDLSIDNATYKIKTYGTDLTLEILSLKFDTKEIIVPDFQRRYVWTPKKASKLIESFLLGLPVPQVFLYREEDTQNLLVVDGQQRLKTINYFIKEKFENGEKFYLRGVKPMWEGKTFSDLDIPNQRRFNNYVLRATIFEQTDPKDNSSIFEIFERLNTGGMALTPQEIRNCVVRGEINNFLNDLNKYENWRNLLNKPQPDTRMKDIEMILRFFSLFNSWKKYKKPMKDFISEFMKNKKDINQVEKEKYSKIFESVIDKIYTEIGTNAFRIKAGINIAVFDSVTVGLAIVEPDKVTDFKQKFDSLKQNPSYLESISKSTTDSDRVESRIKLAIEIFSK